MKPLRIAWKQKARGYRVDASHLGGEGLVLAWQGRAVVPHYAGPGIPDIAVLVDRDGTALQQIITPTRVYRTPAGPVVTWPDEGLIAGVHGERFQLLWIDLDGTSHAVDTELQDRSIVREAQFQLTATSEGGVLVSAPVAHANLDGLGWTIDLRLDSMYGAARRAPFADYDYATEHLTRDGRRWEAPGRVGAIADDIAIMEEGSGASRQIVARRVADGGELWRSEAIDRFVLGTIPMPAWSDDRVYVLDRAARRKQSWAREAETAAIHRVSPDEPMRTILSMRPVSRARLEPLTAPSTLRCLSTRTGEELWHVDVDGDLVSFYCHAKWVAGVVTGMPGKLRVWRHDGTPVGEGAAAPHFPTTAWPPDAGRWPCIAWGDDAHVVVAENRTKQVGPSRLYCATILSPDVPLWETPLPAPIVTAPLLRTLRLLNRVPMAFVDDAAWLRWGKQLYGLVA